MGKEQRLLSVSCNTHVHVYTYPFLLFTGSFDVTGS